MPEQARMSTIKNIVALLREASDAYYNGKPLTMDDETFDGLVETLRQKDPKNPFLAEVGAPPREGAVALPYPMPSLDKIKPGQDALSRFLGAAGPYVLSEKLDGLSALWVPATRKLYLRGDGIVGQDISHLVTLGVLGLVRPGTPTPVAVRGELVVPRSAVQTLARSWVNGVIHQKVPVAADVSRIRFVAYDLLEPKGLTRGQAFAWLLNQGFELPFTKAAPIAPSTEFLAQTLRERRSESAYDTDGIVVAYDAVPLRPVAGKNPKDMVAFKMPLAEQSATTTLEEVLWKPSAQGYLIPTLRFRPVEINGARIEFATGHNARTIVDKGLGAGATIRIRRSGDVIPTLDAVLVGAKEPGLPPTDGTWSWAGNDPAATHIVAATETDAQVATQLQHFFKGVGIAAMGPSNCEALVKADIKGPAALWAASETTLREVLGPKTGATLYSRLRDVLCSNAVTELTLMLASSKLPRGVGETKLKALFEARPDPKTWAQITDAPAGWTAESLAAFQAAFGAYETWRQGELHWLPYPLGKAEQPQAVTAAVTGTICFTGFREKDLEARASAKGYQIAATLSSKVKILVIPDPPKEAGAEKLAKAKALGSVEILRRSEFVQKYLG